MRVTALWRFPVKSMAGEFVESAEVDARGFVGDRRLGVLSEAGKIGSGKNTRRYERVEGLIACRSYLGDGGEVRVVLPGGGEHIASEGAGAEALSAALGRSLRYAVEAEVSHFDVAGIHLVSSASIAWLAEAAQVATDERRLRPNIVVDAGTEPFIEDSWAGRELAVGGVRIRISRRTERCVMTTFAQGELPASPAVLRAIAGEREACLGVYGEIVRPGIVSVGDDLTVFP